MIEISMTNVKGYNLEFDRLLAKKYRTFCIIRRFTGKPDCFNDGYRVSDQGEEYRRCEIRDATRTSNSVTSIAPGRDRCNTFTKIKQPLTRSWHACHESKRW